MIAWFLLMIKKSRPLGILWGTVCTWNSPDKNPWVGSMFQVRNLFLSGDSFTRKWCPWKETSTFINSSLVTLFSNTNINFSSFAVLEKWVIFFLILSSKWVPFPEKPFSTSMSVGKHWNYHGKLKVPPNTTAPRKKNCFISDDPFFKKGKWSCLKHINWCLR